MMIHCDTSQKSACVCTYPVMRLHDRRDLDDPSLRELLEDWPVLVRRAVHVVAIVSTLIRLSATRRITETFLDGVRITVVF